jgi:hypothetical protein
MGICRRSVATFVCKTPADCDRASLSKIDSTKKKKKVPIGDLLSRLDGRWMIELYPSYGAQPWYSAQP